MATLDSASPQPAPRWRDLLFGRWAPVAWTLSLGTGMHATAWYILATALPSAVADVGGAHLVSWIVSIYLIASIVSGSASGLLKARLGSRPLLLAATAVFIAGTVLAAGAPTMWLVIVGRVLQGAGEGVIWAVSAMLVKDLFPLAAVPSMYGVLAVVWALAAVIGPLLSGVLTEAVSWRGALLSMVPFAILYAGMVAFILPPVAPSRAGQRFPLGRLLVIGLGVVALSVGGTQARVEAAFAALVLAVLIVAVALRADARSAVPLFPRRLLSTRAAAPLGIWILTLMFCAEAAVSVYGALLVQTLFGASPVVAGYVLAIVAFAWTVTALLTARLSGPSADGAIVAGPLLLVIGLTGLALALDAMSFTGVCVTFAVIGAGFGVAYTFVTQRVLGGAADNESDVTAGALPTLESAGAAFGAALAGLAGNLAGIAALGEIATVRDAAVWVIAIATLLALPAVVGAVALVRLVPARR
ncbi:MAG: MFS transporter [Alphaproteobacteria bacterium]|nr:MFS transporter [Alphaproteobacteria bacterium]